jgi:hypothetical protein
MKKYYPTATQLQNNIIPIKIRSLGVEYTLQ